MLGAAGYAVRAVHTGNGLRTFLAEEPDWADLILLDMSLPDVMGMTLYEEFSDLDVRWMFITGNVSLPELQSLPTDGPPVIAKPFRARGLREAVLATLGETDD